MAVTKIDNKSVWYTHERMNTPPNTPLVPEWFETIIDTLFTISIALGSFVVAHPQQASFYFVVVVTVLLIGRFIFSALWKIAFFILLPLIVLGVGYVLFVDSSGHELDSRLVE